MHCIYWPEWHRQACWVQTHLMDHILFDNFALTSGQHGKPIALWYSCVVGSTQLLGGHQARQKGHLQAALQAWEDRGSQRGQKEVHGVLMYVPLVRT